LAAANWSLWHFDRLVGGGFSPTLFAAPTWGSEDQLRWLLITDVFPMGDVYSYFALL